MGGTVAGGSLWHATVQFSSVYEEVQSATNPLYPTRAALYHYSFETASAPPEPHVLYPDSAALKMGLRLFIDGSSRRNTNHHFSRCQRRATVFWSLLCQCVPGKDQGAQYFEPDSFPAKCVRIEIGRGLQ